MSDHLEAPADPDPTAAGFRLSLVSPAGFGKAWRPPMSPVWHAAFEPTGSGTPQKRRFRSPSHVESFLGRLLAPTGAEKTEVLYDGPCDPSATEDANRQAFLVGAERPMVWSGPARDDDMSPWAMVVRQERAELEGRRIAALATAEARQRREQDRLRRQGGR